MAAGNAQAGDRLSDAQLLALGDQYEEARGAERRAKQDADDCAAQIIRELEARNETTLAGTEATITLVRAASYDAAGLYGAVRAELRDRLFEEALDFSRLSPPEQRALLACLAPGQRDQVVVQKVRDRDALRHAVESGAIAKRTAKRFTSYGKPSIRVTRGPGTRARRVH